MNVSIGRQSRMIIRKLSILSLILFRIPIEILIDLETQSLK